MDRLRDATLLAGRLLIAALFLWDGVIMLRAPGLAADYMEAYGVPGFLLPAAILAQLGGGLLIVAGWQTRLAALALAGYCVLTALIFHTDSGSTNQLLHFAKNLAIAGGFLFLAAGGPGALALDAIRDRRRA